MNVIIRLVLIAGLLLGQPAGFVHSLSHLKDALPRGGVATSVEVRADAVPAVAEFCDECLAFAQLAVAAPAPPVAILTHVDADPSTSAVAIIRAVSLPFSASLARGPPAA
jgi:hypothetical protein